jgi:hypothetical protein
MSWDFRSYHSRNSIREMIQRNNTEKVGLQNFRLEAGKEVSLEQSPEFGDCIRAFFVFETKIGRGRGVLRLSPEDGKDGCGCIWKAFTFYTSLQELKGHEEKIGKNRPIGVKHGEHSGRLTWLEQRNKVKDMQGMEPTVLIIGAGHSGLDIAARLGMLEIRSLIIDKNERVGDNWRKRYKT